jgi:hypothetical protein
MGAPVLGAICSAGHDAGGTALGFAGGTATTTLSTAARWQVTTGYRWQNSYRHFRGDHEETERIDEGTEVENALHLFDFSLSYQATPRWSFQVSAPFMTVDRISHRNGTETGSTGIGDMSVGAKFWIRRPPSEDRQNIQVGLSLKLPTGNPNVTNRIGANTITVDQSIQLGDSGTGFSIDYMAYKSMQRFTIFSTAAYLFNPKNTHTPTGWENVEPNPPGIGYRGYSAPGTIYSVSDQYLLQAGLGFAVPKPAGLALTVSGRVEGVPARDLIGREDGFRRPGYAVSVGPGFMYSRGQHTWSASVPIAVRRDRTESVSDVSRGAHGDAAFADYILLLSYSKSF